MALCLGLVIGPSLYAQPLVDPTQPPGYNRPADVISAAGPTTQVTQLQLDGILVRDKTKLAWINRMLYKVGDEVAGYRIQTVSTQGVTLAAGDDVLELTLSAQSIKTQIKVKTPL